MKILAVASAGGHWIELLRLAPLLDEHHTTYVSTNPSFSHSVQGKPYFCIPEVSRWNKLKVIAVGLKLYHIIRRVKPDYIISTGAAPGAVALLVGKLLGAKTIWIESLCHIDHISMSGRYVAPFSDRVYTQWAHLAGKKVIYSGKVL